MTDLTLYQIADNYIADMEKLKDMDLDEQTLADTLEGMAGDLEVKSTNVAMFMRNLENTAAAIKEAEKDMAARRKAIENRIDRIKDYLKVNMERTGITKIECPYFVISVKKNPPALKVEDEAKIPDKYFTIPEPPPPVLDKAKLKDDLKAGVQIEGAILTAGTSLQIK